MSKHTTHTYHSSHSTDSAILTFLNVDNKHKFFIVYLWLVCKGYRFNINTSLGPYHVTAPGFMHKIPTHVDGTLQDLPFT